MASTMSLIRRYTIPVLLAGSILLVGCGDSDEGSTAEPGTLDRLFTHAAIRGCGSCHDGNGNGPDLRTKESFRASLRGQFSSDFNWTGGSILARTSTCSPPFRLVEPFDPDKSAVMAALSDSWQHACGAENSARNGHIGQGVNPSAAVIEDLRLWIENGANP